MMGNLYGRDARTTVNNPWIQHIVRYSGYLKVTDHEPITTIHDWIDEAILAS